MLVGRSSKLENKDLSDILSPASRIKDRFFFSQLYKLSSRDHARTPHLFTAHSRTQSLYQKTPVVVKRKDALVYPLYRPWKNPFAGVKEAEEIKVDSGKDEIRDSRFETR